MDIDDKDKKIIEILQKNSRSSIREIAKATGIKPSTVHQRITKLRKQGVIQRFTTKINREYIGENIIIYALATTEKQLDQLFLKNKHIKEATTITGEYDLILKLAFKDMNEYNEFMKEFKKKAEVKKVITMVGTKHIKE